MATDMLISGKRKETAFIRMSLSEVEGFVNGNEHP